MFAQLAQLAFKQMFDNQPVALPEGVDFDISYTMSNLTKIVVRMLLKNKRVFRVTFLEQNPYKSSVYAQRAKKGAQIMWAIAQFDSKEKWLGRIEDGIWYPK